MLKVPPTALKTVGLYVKLYADQLTNPNTVTNNIVSKICPAKSSIFLINVVHFYGFFNLFFTVGIDSLAWFI